MVVAPSNSTQCLFTSYLVHKIETIECLYDDKSSSSCPSIIACRLIGTLRKDYMTFWYKGHHYGTQFKHNLKTFLWLDKFYHGWKGRYSNRTWIGHMDDCCDYWTPVDSPEAQRAFMLDDELGLKK